MTVTSIWEWKCWYFPDMAEDDYIASLDMEQQIEISVLKSLKQIEGK